MPIIRITLYDYPLQKGSIFDNLLGSSLDLLRRAQEEAVSLNQHCVTSLHLLLALYHSPPIKEFLETKGLADKSVRRALAHSLECKEEVKYPDAIPPGCTLPISDRLLKAIIKAACVAMEAERRRYVQPEDLLIGLLEEGTNEAASLLISSGISLHKVYNYFQYPQGRVWYRLKRWL